MASEKITESNPDALKGTESDTSHKQFRTVSLNAFYDREQFSLHTIGLIDNESNKCSGI